LENGYAYDIPTEEYDLPLTVFRPYFRNLFDRTIRVNDTLSFVVEARNPADGVPSFEEAPAAVISDAGSDLVCTAEKLPEGASFDTDTHRFVFTPKKPGTYRVTFTIDDGVIPVTHTVTFTADP
jgi:hypothetical protein